MQSPTALVSACSNFIWGVPMLVMLFGAHLFLTARLRLVQRHIPKAIRLSLSPDEGSQGEISQFGALATALAATIGTGNIIGVSTAIALGVCGWQMGTFMLASEECPILVNSK